MAQDPDPGGVDPRVAAQDPDRVPGVVDQGEEAGLRPPTT
jgi:hypothetical protein